MRNSPVKQKLFNAVYWGKKKFKTVREVSALSGIDDTKRVTEIAGPLVRGAKLFEQDRMRIDGKVQTVYKKIPFVAANKRTILQLANNKRKLESYHTKSNPKTPTQRIVIRSPFKIKTRYVSIDQVEQFARVKKSRSVRERLFPERLPEKKIKAGLVRLLGERRVPKDWGGEINDIFTTRLRLRGRSRPAAFALKGPSKKGPLVPGMMGKNGDQIQRLFDSPAEVFFVQYEGEIKQSVNKLMEQLATAKAVLGTEVFWGVIDLDDTYRLRLAYPAAFRAR